MQTTKNYKGYKTNRLGDNFFFETNQNIFYKVGFIKINLFPDKVYSNSVYEFSISTENDKRNYDPLVRNTIFFILKEFCSNSENIFYYTCDSTDSKHVSRFRLFNRWFLDLAPSNFTKIDQKFNELMLMSIIVNHDNIFYNHILFDIPFIFDHLKSYKDD